MPRGYDLAGDPTVWANSTRCSGLNLISWTVFALSRLWNQAAKPCEAANAGSAAIAALTKVLRSIRRSYRPALSEKRRPLILTNNSTTRLACMAATRATRGAIGLTPFGHWLDSSPQM